MVSTRPFTDFRHATIARRTPIAACEDTSARNVIFRRTVDHRYQRTLVIAPNGRIHLPVAYTRLPLHYGIPFADVYTIRYQAAPSTALVTSVITLSAAAKQLALRSPSYPVAPNVPVDPCSAQRNDPIMTKPTRDWLQTPVQGKLLAHHGPQRCGHLTRMQRRFLAPHLSTDRRWRTTQLSRYGAY